MKKVMSTSSFMRMSGPQMTVIVTAMDPDSKDKKAAITLAWTTPLSMKPPLFGVSIAPNRFSHDIIKRAGVFTVNIPPLDYLKETEWVGRHSGKKVEDKLAEAGLTTRPGKSSGHTISINEALASFECKLVDEVTTGDHTLFVGEVVHAEAADEFFDDKKGWNFDKARLIYHAGKDVFITNKEGICSK
ncbi:flavin reductase family protein [Candidatus Thorarchaeota archaeon]|nr:MAG: flavin reductase family protein [Candidatus Thorarchaeota archaeon]